MEHHNDYIREGGDKRMERGSWFIQLISIASDGIQILPGLEMQSYNVIRDMIGIFLSAAFSS